SSPGGSSAASPSRSSWARAAARAARPRPGLRDLHEAERRALVRPAVELVLPLAELDRHRLRADEARSRDVALDARALEHEAVDRGPVADDDRVRAGLERRHRPSRRGLQADREAGADGTLELGRRRAGG